MRGFTINADYVHVDGFEITNLRSHFPDSTGVFTNGAQDEISGCYIHHSVNDAGVVISGRSAPRNNLVKNNMISRKPQYDLKVDRLVVVFTMAKTAFRERKITKRKAEIPS
ncbi:MAG: hypothetical protein DMG97_03180 [Acidobacteria bacterium]|nr:MAG: hypothetical protein DMG97_03180 [Acidobacteriota bacterium]